MPRRSINDWRDGGDTWDSPRELLSLRPPYWLREPPRPALLDKPRYLQVRPPPDGATLDLFTEKRTP